MNRDDILATAANLIRGARHENYGDFADNAECFAEMANAYLRGRNTIEPRDVAALMILFKIMRLRHGPHEDSWVDIAGYAGLGGEVDSD